MAVGSILVGAATATGALVGLVTALLLTPLAAAVGSGPAAATSTELTAALVGVGVTLDGLRLSSGRPAPPTVGRQVPREWVWVFPARITAGLYGARLGVGPSTILSTWTWWSFSLAAALRGPGIAAVVGGSFGLVRLVVTAWVSLAASPSDHASTFGRLRASRRPGWTAITVMTAVLALTAVGCGSLGESGDESANRPILVPTDPPDRLVGHDRGDRSGRDPTSTLASTPNPTPTPTPSPTPTPTPTPSDRPGEAPADLISPAELEDVVRTRSPTNSPTDTPIAAALGGPDAEPASLADSLLVAIDDFEPILEPDADRYLDLRAAAEVQPDPTEEIALLETRGYRGGWMRAFRNDDNDVAVTTVYQFQDPTEAEFYLEDGLITIGGYGGSFFDIPDLPGVRGFVQDIASSDGESTEDLVSLGASFHRGDRWYLLYFLGSPETVTPEVLVPAVTALHRSAGA